MELLVRLERLFESYHRVWVTEDSTRARDLESSGEHVELLPHYGRNPGRAVINMRAVSDVIARTRPELIVTSGGGLSVPFCLRGRASGAKVIFVETMARATNASKSGRVLSRLADHVLVQWPEMTNVYAGATACRPALLEQVARAPAPPGRGTFVALGTWKEPFDRLLRMVDDAAGAGILPAPIVVQSGSSTHQPKHFEAQQFLDPDALDMAIELADVVVSHGGAGILASALRAGRRPLVLPRLRRFREHVDDHQQQIAAKLAERGLAVPLEDAITSRDVEAARAPWPQLVEPDEPALEEELERVMAAVSAPRLALAA